MGLRDTKMNDRKIFTLEDLKPYKYNKPYKNISYYLTNNLY